MAYSVSATEVQVLYRLADAFLRADGALGGAWEGDTWTITDGVVTNTPTLQDELLADEGIEAWTNATTPATWIGTAAGASTVNRETTTIHGGTYACRQDVDVAESGVQIAQTARTRLGLWHRLTCYLRSSAAGKMMSMTATNSYSTYPNPGMTWTQYLHSFWTSAHGTMVTLGRGTASSLGSLYFDDVSLKPFDQATLVASLLLRPATNMYVSVGILAVTSYSQAGLVLNLDNPDHPQRYIVAYHDGINCRLELFSDGFGQQLISAVTTFVAGARLEVRKVAAVYSLYYNGIQVGSSVTVTDSTLTAGRRYGLFSTDSGNKLVDFLCVPSATKLVIIGDSISDAVTEWPTLAKAAAKQHVLRLSNYAASGAGVLHHDGYSDFDDEAALAAAADTDADVVVVLLGTNDTTYDATFGVEYQENLAELIAACPDATVYALGILNRGDVEGENHRDEKNVLIAAACIATGATYINTDGWLTPATDMSDGLHPTAAGQAKLARYIQARIPTLN